MPGIALLLTLLTLFASCGKSTRQEKPIFPIENRAGVTRLFARYKCPVELSQLRGEPNPKSLEKWGRFRTRLLDGASRKVNFGGKYILLEWGCGTECQTGVLIDASNGRVHEIPTSEWGKEYRSNSTLLIINPPSPAAGPARNRPAYANPAYYQWQGERFKLLRDTRN